MPGPIPKRSEDKLGHGNGKANAPSKVERTVAGLAGPDLWFPAHPVAEKWYEELRKSPQSHAYYVESDWATAQIAAKVLSTALEQGARMSAVLIGEFNKIAGTLMVTESDRRRMKIEIERAQAEPEEDTAKVSYLERARSRKTS